MNAALANLPFTTPCLAPDPALPQRDLLLDEQRMVARFSLLMSRDGSSAIDSCEKQRIKYRVGESLRVLYRLSVNGRRQLVAAKAFAGAQARTAGGARGKFEHGAFIDADIPAAFWIFPNDRKLEHLNLLGEVPPEFLPLSQGKWRRSEAVAYVPEKCATVRCQDSDGQIVGYAKMYAAAEGEKVHRTYIELASVCPHVVKALGYSHPYRLMLLEAVPGTRIADLKDEELKDSFAGLARTLASLHSAPVPSGLPGFHRHELDRLRECVRIISLARPDVAQAANRLHHRLRSSVPPAEPVVCLHGDVHPKNGIASNGLVTLIDLDQSAIGPSAADLGSLLALLHYNWRTGLLTCTRKRELASAFLDAYGGSRPLPSEKSLSWHTAAALLSERALRSVNRIRPEGLLHLEQLLNDAREILDTDGVNL